MTLADLLASLFPDGLDVCKHGGVLSGSGMTRDNRRADVIGIVEGEPLGVDEALWLSAAVLAAVRRGGDGPLLVLVDSDSQRMSKRDELLGLNEYLAHLAKCLIQADLGGRPTIGLLYGHTAAGAFIATALATRTLVALPGAEPEVMDLPSMAKVTKLSIDVLRDKARSTPVFAPGLDNLAQTGAVLLTWDEKASLADQLQALLQGGPETGDRRDHRGRDRQGRMKAADVAGRVYALAVRSV